MNGQLPIDESLGAVRAALAARGMAVLQAPPGAGKTTRVPLDLLDSGLVAGRILMLEPRRLAARAAAERMAEALGEPVGGRVGYRIRGEVKVSGATQIEVVTEGILTRMIQTDPELAGVGLVIFDEFHERSLFADLGLALCLEVRGALREDLMLLVMSATLDAAPVAALMGGAEVITSAGQAYRVETRWLARAPDASLRYEAAVAALVRQALMETGGAETGGAETGGAEAGRAEAGRAEAGRAEAGRAEAGRAEAGRTEAGRAEAGIGGGVLVFLPGEGEIRRVEALLTGIGCPVQVLFGAMEFAAQRAVLAPVSAGRRVVLATSIAETSLTLPDIRVVVDAGRARRARFDAGSGMSRLVTERVTRAEAEQRRGRAGRVAAGVCYRLWTRGEEGGMAAYPPAEIEAADLTGLALELALWGGDLPFLTPPHPGVLAEARAVLAGLGALEGGRITPHGRALAALPLHPRLGHMLAVAGRQAAVLAALLAERDPLRGVGVDLGLRLAAVRGPADGAHRGTLDRVRAEARRLARAVDEMPKAEALAKMKPAEGGGGGLSVGQMAALAYPDRVGLRRKGEAARWVLSGGKGAVMPAGDALAGSRLIVATDLDGDAREAQVRQAVAITEAELRAVQGAGFVWRELCEWSRRESRVLARRQECFGALVLGDRAWEAPDAALRAAALEGVRDLGLPWTPAARRFRARVELARGGGGDWPECSDEALLAGLEGWLLPHLGGVLRETDIRALDLTEALRARLSWDQQAALDRAVPSHFETPLGRRVPIDYDGEVPGIEVRLQEMFGVVVHPVVGARATPLRITLLSPGQRPVQVTRDLPGFWARSYAEVRRDMRGAYPRHPWPEDPTVAEPTLRAKPRGT